MNYLPGGPGMMGWSVCKNVLKWEGIIECAAVRPPSLPAGQGRLEEVRQVWKRIRGAGRYAHATGGRFPAHLLCKLIIERDCHAHDAQHNLYSRVHQTSVTQGRKAFATRPYDPARRAEEVEQHDHLRLGRVHLRGRGAVAGGDAQVLELRVGGRRGRELPGRGARARPEQAPAYDLERRRAPGLVMG